jgi:hypothetical protein
MIAVVWLDVLGAGVAAERSQPTALTAAQQARLQERDRLRFSQSRAAEKAGRALPRGNFVANEDVAASACLKN